MGAGPAGLSAAYELIRQGTPVTVIEKDRQVGGIARTLEFMGCRFDVGPHRFFSKSPEIEALWCLAAIRLCTSVCLSAHRRVSRPDNAYLTISEEPAWRTLEAMRTIHPRLAHYTLRAACARGAGGGRLRGGVGQGSRG